MKNIFKKKSIKTLRNRVLFNKLLEAEERGSYFVCLTIKDKTKDTGDLTHTIFSNNFAVDDFYPSLDEYAKLAETEKMNVKKLVKK